MPFAGPPCARVAGFSSPASLDNTCLDTKNNRPPLCAILRAASTDREQRTKIRFRRLGLPVQEICPMGMQMATCAGIAAPARSLASSVRPLIRSVRVFVRFFLHSLVRSLVCSFARSLARSLLRSFIRSFTCRLAWTL